MSTDFSTTRSFLTSSQDSVLDISYTAQNTESDEAVEQTFEQFLEDKATNGFTTREKLKYRGIEYINATSLGARIRAFFSLGGIGRLFISKVEAQNEELINRAKFYRDCCKVQEVFGKFKNKPDAAFQELKDAYEAVLAAGANENEHAAINALLDNKLIGASVGRSLLEKAAKTQFGADGFTTQGIVGAISGQKFTDDIESKYALGYRARLDRKNDRDLDSIDVLDCIKGNIKEEKILNLLSHEGTASLFLCSARAYSELASTAQGRRVDMSVVNQLNNREVTSNDVAEAIAGYNKLILEMIQNPDLLIEPSEVPPGYRSVKAFVDHVATVRESYNAHNSNMDSLNQLNLELQGALQRQEKASAATRDLQDKTHAVSYEQLEQIFLGQGGRENLPGAQFYREKLGEIGGLNHRIAESEQAIAEKKETLRQQIERLTARKEQLAQEVAQFTQEAKDAKALYDQALAEQQRYIAIEGVAALSNSEFEQISQANQSCAEKLADWQRKNARLNLAKAELTQVARELTAAEAEQKLLDLETDELCVAQSRLTQELTSLKQSTIALPYLAVCELNTVQATDAFLSVVEGVTATQREAQESNTAVQGIQERIESLTGQITRTAGELREAGFVLNKQNQIQTSLFSFAGFKERAFKGQVREALEQRNVFTRNAILAMRLATTPLEKIRDEQTFNPRNHAASSPAKAKQERRGTNFEEVDYIPRLEDSLESSYAAPTRTGIAVIPVDQDSSDSESEHTCDFESLDPIDLE